MKKIITLCTIAIIMIMSLVGCSQVLTGSELYTFPEVDEVKLEHYVGSGVAYYTLDKDEEITQLKDWFNSLECIQIPQEPSGEDELDEWGIKIDNNAIFYYKTYSDNSATIRMNGNYYNVTNPTSIPVGNY